MHYYLYAVCSCGAICVLSADIFLLVLSSVVLLCWHKTPLPLLICGMLLLNRAIFLISTAHSEILCDNKDLAAGYCSLSS